MWSGAGRGSPGLGQASPGADPFSCTLQLACRAYDSLLGKEAIPTPLIPGRPDSLPCLGTGAEGITSYSEASLLQVQSRFLHSNSFAQSSKLGLFSGARRVQRRLLPDL